MTNEIIFSDMERDVIGEVMNISLGSSATSLSALLGKRVEITVPKVNVINAGAFSFEGLEPAIGTEIRYIEGLDGVNLMILKRMDAKAIIEILMGQSLDAENFVMDEINTSAICEVMNQMMGSAATALSDFIGKPINITTPIAYEIESKAEFKSKYFNDDDIIVAVSFNLFIEDIIQSEFVNVMPLEFSRELVSIFLNTTDMDLEKNEGSNSEKNATGSKDKAEYSKNNSLNNFDKNNEYEDDGEDEDYIKEEVQEKKQNNIGNSKVNTKVKLKKKEQIPVNIKAVEYENFDDYEEDGLNGEKLSNLELIMSVPLEISVEIGKTKKQIKEILEFTQGTIVELDKQAGALVDIIVNGQLIAKGEVVVVNDYFGVRVAEIIKKDDILQITV